MDSDPQFTVAVAAEFDEAGVWVIDTKVTFLDGIASQTKADLVGEVRLALLRGIIEQGTRGRTLGATEVRVILDDPGRELLPNGLPELH